MSTTSTRTTAGRDLFHAEGWDGWDELPPRLREDWCRVAAGQPLTRPTLSCAGWNSDNL